VLGAHRTPLMFFSLCSHFTHTSSSSSSYTYPLAPSTIPEPCVVPCHIDSTSGISHQIINNSSVRSVSNKWYSDFSGCLQRSSGLNGECEPLQIHTTRCAALQNQWIGLMLSACSPILSLRCMTWDWQAEPPSRSEPHRGTHNQQEYRDKPHHLSFRTPHSVGTVSPDRGCTYAPRQPTTG